MTESPGREPLLVACLCAAWCHTCGDYRATFDTLALEFGARAIFVWIDIEDHEAALGGVEVDDFPTLLLAAGDELRFHGPVLPHAAVARQMVQRALLGPLGAPSADAALAGLPARLRAIA